jgi:hypothetical protein
MHDRAPNQSHTNITSTNAKILSALLVSAAELSLFHPLNTIAVRLQINMGRVFSAQGLRANFANFFHIATTGGSLYSGFGVAAVDKIVKRGYKFAGHGIIRENILEPSVGDIAGKMLGDSHKNPLLDAMAGSLIGMGEVIFLPLDYLKTNLQNKSSTFNGRNMLSVLFSKEGYTGWPTILSRNFIGSAILFGISSATYEYAFNLTNRKDATNMQNFTASALGAMSSVVLTMPWDVVKTRMQIQNPKINAGSEKVSGLKLAKKMLVTEGLPALFKGGGVKTLSTGGKLTFGLTAYRSLTIWADKQVSKREKGPEENARPSLTNNRP